MSGSNWNTRIEAFTAAMGALATEHGLDFTGVVTDQEVAMATIVSFGAKTQNLTMRERIQRIDDAATMLRSATPDVEPGVA